MIQLHSSKTLDLEQAAVGCVLGTAVGDAIGLPWEGLSRQRQEKLCRSLNGHHLLFGRGMVSDDTEHACIVAQALIESAGDADAFGRCLARRLRLWLLGAPAGVGFATLRVCLKLWLGFGWQKSGVFSAGNGPAMRSALLGVCYGDDPSRLRQLVHVSTVITHTDSKAEYGAMAVALAAHLAHTQPGIEAAEYLRILKDTVGSEAGEFVDLVSRAVQSVAAGQTTEEFAASLGLASAVSGYVYHTVPVVLHAWFRHPSNYQTAITEVVRCGGDTDTTAAILGAILGAGLGADGLPSAWLNGLCEWPRSVSWMTRLGQRLTAAVSEQKPQSAPSLPFAFLLPRNLLFLAVVLAHGFRRLLPPY